jgi:hypothetical protein
MSFARSVGFDVASCAKCGDWTSVDGESMVAMVCCGAEMKMQAAAGWEVSGKGERDGAMASKIAPYVLRMKVKPAKQYESRKNSEFAVAIDRLLVEGGGEGLRVERKFKFVVCNKTLPGMAESKAASKPLERYWPIDETPKKYFDDGLRIDTKWYEGNVSGYVCSAFGFDSLEVATQRDLSRWF